MEIPITVFMMDDSLLVREGLKRIISPHAHIRIIGETNEPSTILQHIKTLKPSICMLEMDLCQQPLKDLIAEVVALSPSTKVLVLSDCDCELPIVMAVRSGISGYLHKKVSEEELLQALHTIAKGKSYFTPHISQILSNGILGLAQGSLALTNRELEILRLICKGRSNEQMADLLCIAEKTILTHRKNIMKKVGVKKSSELIVWAFDNHLVTK